MSEPVEQNSSLRVISMNVLNVDELFVERFTAIVREASEKEVDVLLLQEVLFCYEEELRVILKGFGYNYAAFGEPLDRITHKNVSYGNIIASKLPFEKTLTIELTPDPQAIRGMSGKVIFNGYEVLFVSAHLYWGASNGHIRLRQARILNDFTLRAKTLNPNLLVVLGGDFNEEPDSDAVRYIQGTKVIEDTPNAFWLDATKYSELEKQPTTKPHGEWGAKTAQRVGVLDHLAIPERKLDYLFAHGWVYGNPGMPKNTAFFGTTTLDDGTELSDHFGLITDIWLPNI